ncbi:MAG: hypothetical protein ACXACK_07490, partial [Candidatus Hodarchaeales archaeon]
IIRIIDFLEDQLEWINLLVQKYLNLKNSFKRCIYPDEICAKSKIFLFLLLGGDGRTIVRQ